MSGVSLTPFIVYKTPSSNPTLLLTQVLASSPKFRSPQLSSQSSLTIQRVSLAQIHKGTWVLQH